MTRNNNLAYGYTVTVTPTKEQLVKIKKLRGTEYVMSHDIRKNYLDEILDNAIKTYCVGE